MKNDSLSFSQKQAEYVQIVQKTKNISNIFKQLLLSQQPKSWKIIQSCISQIEVQQSRQISRTIEDIKNNVEEIKSLPMLLYSFKLNKDYNGLTIYCWKRKYQALVLEQDQLQIFNTWISSCCTDEEVQETLAMVISLYPTFFRSQYLKLTELELNSIIYWLQYSKIKSPEKFKTLCDLANLVKENNLFKLFVSTEDYLQKEHMILRNIIKVVCQTTSTSSHVYLLLYPLSVTEDQVKYVCYVILEDYIQQLDQNTLCKLFIGLTRNAISKEILFIINHVSQVLLRSQGYFKLRIIFQKFVLPILASKAKSCPKIEDQIYNICKWYIYGFLRHCNIGITGIKCILNNISEINSIIKIKWVQIAQILKQIHPQHKQLIEQSLKIQGLLKQNQIMNYNSIDLVEIEKQVWKVTGRNARKHKTYQKTKSKVIKGIYNQSNQCYMISVVQGLYLSGTFQEFLEENKDIIKAESPLLTQLRLLFKQLSGKMKSEKIVVNYLQKKGPEQFVRSERQQDAQQFLLHLFESIQISLHRLPKLLKEFQKIYQINYINTITCDCGQSLLIQQKQYLLSISHDEFLRQSSTEVLQDYICEKCKKKGGKRQRKLKLECQIFIVHINRFSHVDGKTQKLLSNQKIQRNFMGYQLVGMICHFGKDTSCGHYIYYSKIQKTKWVEISDQRAFQFKLDDQNQEFERQMKSQRTPYILFYRRKHH